jgi:cation diffusion facilitator CzcD-associated flavoprotein CzcO
MVVLPWPELSNTRPNTALEHALTLKHAMDKLLSHAEANKRKSLPIAMFKELVESFTELHDQWAIQPLPAADMLDSLRRIEAEARDLKTATQSRRTMFRDSPVREASLPPWETQSDPLGGWPITLEETGQKASRLL